MATPTIQALAALAYEVYDHHPETAMRLIDSMTEAEAKAFLGLAVVSFAERWESRD